MDRFGTAASLWDLVEATIKIYTLIRDVNGAAITRERILQELQADVGILTKVAQVVEHDRSRVPNLRSLTAPQETLDQYRRLIGALIPRLTTGQGLQEIANRCKLVAGKRDVDDILIALDWSKGTFIACLGFDQLDVSLSQT